MGRAGTPEHCHPEAAKQRAIAALERLAGLNGWLPGYFVPPVYSRSAAPPRVRAPATSKLYVRGSASGRAIKFHLKFGATVFWNAEFVPELLGIVFGAFADPSMPSPTVSV